jgi:hypothetical protein
MRAPAIVEPPSSAEEEAPLPLVRRAQRPSMAPPPLPAPSVASRTEPQHAEVPPTQPHPAQPPHAQPHPAQPPRTMPMLPPSTARGPGPEVERPRPAAQPQEARHETADFEMPRAPPPLPPPPAAMPIVLDFSSAARETRDAPATHRGAPPAPSRTSIAPKLPPYPSLTRTLESLDAVEGRDELVAVLLEGVSTFARGSALFAARRGRFVGVAADGIDLARFRDANLGTEGAVAEAIELGERVGVLRSAADTPLLEALELAGAPSLEVVLRPAFVSGRPALLIAAWGIGDLQEGARRARALATSASAALERLLKSARGG